ncbi:UDP-N-acetylmuramoylalanine--D-glutamate ligase [Endomicrobiia bacterium]|nr:UDP-N-acetylmuramoylalanine--D-glutamate ligase [Endomicrobiia bacterium]GHT12859.1 UDP-N-acetylmuramoylalanine--D-glutamate ligase [Endomicrobiia bacterium]GHT18460.1 UDP-N-acetylmuramoylalanine--D-glutamate ligase [Endomicrobiia bacterium]GHT27611.1 UDP-N-acetylmuramoylalanine--D-glutamate ligase [Endomicrobiia bacterium]GHT30713.1 UDP-N-acetylmuramoylalanine--D-glutamate ligase [Endomicrobiia bacterium]
MKKNIGILGLGKSGVAAANLAVKLGYNVFASDSKEKKIKNLNKKVIKEFGGHSDKVLNSDVIIKSPGVHSNIPILKKARKQKIKIMSELAFSLENSKYKKIMAVSGTNGKTTVTDLISKIIKAAHKDSIVSGNIGCPLADKALKTTETTFITMELSSYQLGDTPDFRPTISVLLNITPDHLEYHKTMKAYLRAKENIFINQRDGDFTVINYDDKICRKIFEKTKAAVIFFSKTPLKKGVFYDSGSIVINVKEKHYVIKPKINIVGTHNIENILAAVAASYAAGVKPAVIEKIVSKYKGVEHRIEFVKTLNGVDYYNDSKSTNIDSTRVALESFDKNILIIMGGRDKGVPYTPLKELVKQRVKLIFLIGEASDKIKKDLNGASFVDCGNMENAVKQIFRTAVRADIALLSPACASFDQFENFEERGKVFKKMVLSLGSGAIS